MRDDISRALEADSSASREERVIDITTIGRRSGEPRRIETVIHRVDGEVYLSGRPRDKPRAWLLNLLANPEFTFHLKGPVVADLPATATVITDPEERRRILGPIVESANRRGGPDRPALGLEDWIAHAPLARVTFPDASRG